MSKCTMVFPNGCGRNKGKEKRFQMATYHLKDHKCEKTSMSLQRLISKPHIGYFRKLQCDFHLDI